MNEIYNSGAYRVGIDIQAGKYKFVPIITVEDDLYATTATVLPMEDGQYGMRVSQHLFGENGYGIIDLSDGMMLTVMKNIQCYKINE